MKVFIIPGYGIPESIERDQNYSTYLHVAFNRIYDAAKGEKALIIPCGGPTNCTPPYDGTEAAMMGDYIKKLIDRPMMGNFCKAWSVQLENQSLSLLENLVFAKRLIDETGGAEVIAVFCETTRENRVRNIAAAVFGKPIPIIVESIDFDISPNRYLTNETFAERELNALQSSLAALGSSDRFAKEHEISERKLALLRSLQDGGMSHVDAVAEWYRQAPSIIAEVISNHPTVK